MAQCCLILVIMVYVIVWRYLCREFYEVEVILHMKEQGLSQDNTGTLDIYMDSTQPHGNTRPQNPEKLFRSW